MPVLHFRLFCGRFGLFLRHLDGYLGPVARGPGVVPGEYSADGVFGRLSRWLDGNMARFGFHRPYASAGCGAGMEPWHLSYGPLSSRALEELTLPLLKRAIAGSEMLGKAQVLERLPEIYTRFILAVDSPAPAAYRAACQPA